MHPMVKGAAALAVITAIGGAFPEPDSPEGGGNRPGDGGRTCPPRTLPDGVSCAPLPALGAGGGRDAEAERPLRPEPTRARIPRLPDRPRELSAYRLPLTPPPGVSRGDPAHARTAGDPDAADRLELRGAPGGEVRLVALRDQEGGAQVLHVGDVDGRSVVTRHAVREGGGTGEYLVVHAGLARVADGVVRGARLWDGDLLGVAGDAAPPGASPVTLTINKLRVARDLDDLPPDRLLDPALTATCDPRNVLPLVDSPLAPPPPLTPRSREASRHITSL